jgi:flavin reductase (DIM6/NTAB) family NADH-FMN oxidoreductase RutF
MGKLTWNGGALIAPVPPVMVSCGDDDHSNILTIAWTGIINTIPPKTYISIRPLRHSYNIIKNSGEFVINLAPASIVRSVDYCGIYTGAKVNKWERCNLHKAPASKLSCPMIEECPISLECKVTDIIPLGTHDMFLADIVATNVNEDLLNDSGKLCMERANLIAYAHGEYYQLGQKIGNFGFSATKKRKNQ